MNLTKNILLVLLVNATCYFSKAQNSTMNNFKNEEIDFDNYLTITYIGVAGYMLESGNDKVMIDAFYTLSGASGFMAPPSTVINDIKEGIAPYNDVDVYLVGHSHADHFSASTVNEFMAKNTSANLVCQPDAEDLLKNVANSNYGSFSNRITSPELSDFQTQNVTLNDVNIKITKFPAYSYHDEGLFTYNIEIGNFKILFLMGKVLTVSDYTKSFNDSDNDIILASSFYAENTSVIKNNLNYKLAYINHLYKYSTKLSDYQSTCSALRSDGYEVYMQNSAMETHIIKKESDTLKLDVELPVNLNNSIQKSEFNIFPNPSSGIVNIMNWSDNFYNINIFDIAGKLVYSDNKITNIVSKINLSDQKKGIYFIKIKNGNDLLGYQKIILN